MKRFIGFGLFLLLLGTFSCDGPRNLVLVEPITDIDSALESMGIQHERLASLTSKLEGRENFVLCVDQLLDHTDPSQGTFRQKVYLSHIDSDAPMVLYLITLPEQPEVHRANIVVVLALTSFAVLVSMLAVGVVDMRVVTHTVTFFIPSVLAVWLGAWLFRKLPADLFKLVVLWFLVAISIAILVA